MSTRSSRRGFLKASSAVVASSVVGSILSGCATTTPAPLSASEQLALTASQAVEAIRTGRLSAEAYMTTLIARAEQLSEMDPESETGGYARVLLL